jgi:hypothetical protein
MATPAWAIACRSGLRSWQKNWPDVEPQERAEIDHRAPVAERPARLVLEHRDEDAPGALLRRLRIDHRRPDHLAHGMADAADLEIAVDPWPIERPRAREGLAALFVVGEPSPAGVRGRAEIDEVVG